MKRNKAIVIGLLAVLLLAGAGSWGYFEATRLERTLDDVYYEPSGEALAYLANHAEDPRVLEVLQDLIHTFAWTEIEADLAIQRTWLRQIAAVFTAQPPALDPDLLYSSFVARGKFDLPEIVKWMPVAPDDPKIAGPIWTILQAIGEDPETWPNGSDSEREFAGQVLRGVLAELAERGLADETRIQQALVPIALRFDLPQAGAGRQGLVEDAASADRVVAYFRAAISNRESEAVLNLLLEGEGGDLAELGPAGRAVFLRVLVNCSQAGYSAAARCLDRTLALGPAAGAELRALAAASEDAGFQEDAEALAAELGDSSTAVAAVVARIERRLPAKPWSVLELQRPYAYLPGATPAALSIMLAEPVAQLTAIGPDGATPLIALLFEDEERSLNRQALVVAATQAAAAIDPGLLADAVARQFRSFEPAARDMEARRQTNAPVAVSDARYYLSEASLLIRSLDALRDAPAGQAVDVAFFEALSCPVASFSEYASKILRERVDGDAFADALFVFLAQKEQYSRFEINRYIAALTGYDAIAAGIARNLDGLLARAKGRPERVFWAYKLIGLEALAQVGTPDEVALLEAYAADRSSYIDFTTDALTGAQVEEITRTFSDLVQRSIDAIGQR